MTTQRIIIIGGGTDAPGIAINLHTGKVEKIPGWNPEVMLDLNHAVNVIRHAAQLKTPGLAEKASQSVAQFVQRELGEHVKAGDVLVIT